MSTRSFCICKSYSHFFSKNNCELDIILTRIDNVLTTNKLVKLTMFWTTGPSNFIEKKKALSRAMKLSLNHSLAEHDMPCFSKQCRSKSVGFCRSQLIWICTVVIKYVNFYQKPKSSNLIGWKVGMASYFYSAWQGFSYLYLDVQLYPK